MKMKCLRCSRESTWFYSIKPYSRRCPLCHAYHIVRDRKLELCGPQDVPYTPVGRIGIWHPASTRPALPGRYQVRLRPHDASVIAEFDGRVFWWDGQMVKSRLVMSWRGCIVPLDDDGQAAMSWR
jgi:hypothetical protein